MYIRPIGKGGAGGALAPPFETEIYKQRHVKWCFSLATHYSLVCEHSTLTAIGCSCVPIYKRHVHWPTYYYVHPSFNESGYGPVYTYTCVCHQSHYYNAISMCIFCIQCILYNLTVKHSQIKSNLI